jgi:RNA polymerase sigma factor (sigma-70 family)
LVYGTALRKMGDAAAAEEVTQDVFAALASKAWQFGPGDSVAAWLHRATLLKAKQWWRGEFRRRSREKSAAELGTTMKAEPNDSSLQQLLPMLDEALLSLRERDRTVLLLRFQENRSLREIGRSLDIREDAAQKRVALALEKAAHFFRRRGFRTASAAVTAAALERTAACAPVALVNLLTQTAMQAVPPSTGGTIAILSRLASLTKVQSGLLCAVMLIVPVSIQWNKLQAARVELSQARAADERARQNMAATELETQRLQAALAQSRNALAAAAIRRTQNDEAMQRLADLKVRLHSMLASPAYLWPSDLPFARVPQSAIDYLVRTRQPFDPSSGRLAADTTELLGLTPEEKAFVESHLSSYLQKLSVLASRFAYETNDNSVVYPKPWLQIAIVVPPLGEERERLWSADISPIRDMLGTQRANQFDMLWIQSIWSGGTYPFSYDDNERRKPSAAEYVLAINPDGTGTPPYRLFLKGVREQEDQLPFQTMPPGFLREHFEPWLNSLGFYNIYPQQP